MANLEVEIIEDVNHVTAYRDPAFVAAIKALIEKHGPALLEGAHGDLSR